VENLRFVGCPSERWVALLFIVGTYVLFDHVAIAIAAPLAKTFHLPVSTYGELKMAPYVLLMVVRLGMDLLVVGAICRILRRRLSGFPLVGPRMGKLMALGLVTGLVVMVCVILAILITKNARVAVSMQPALSALFHGGAWLIFDFVGATGEELFGRMALLLVAERFVGWRGAIIVSGLMFSIVHLGNPGASEIWLTRLFFQGVLLAYAVYRTKSIWWSVGYHTGWNWASAPLFGAAGSGYLDEGHLMDFTPTGSGLMTGGAVGPEGSVFAFVAVLCAFVLLKTATSGSKWIARQGTLS